MGKLTAKETADATVADVTSMPGVQTHSQTQPDSERSQERAINVADTVLARPNPPVRSFPSVRRPQAHEVEAFFCRLEQLQPQQDDFTEKYNFDFEKELPLAGRYEWEKV